VSAGEGAEFNGMDPGGLYPAAFGPTRTDPNEDIGAFRAQDITNICGKVLRLNPANGQGYASNPFATGDLTANQSKVYAYGLRNPFRFTVRPGTGSPNLADGNPGALYLGDVGWSTYEEFSISTGAGQNFGWPCYEGFTYNTDYQNATPAHNGCGSVGTATNPSPWRPPVSVWHHFSRPLSVPPGVFGVSSVGGMFYTRTSWPGAYRGRAFADYGGDWIHMATVSQNNGDQFRGLRHLHGGARGPAAQSVDRRHVRLDFDRPDPPHPLHRRGGDHRRWRSSARRR
jgi:glucose/arabinose dehydrogenase